MTQVFRSLEQAAGAGATVASVGNFDGVHIAHREVLARVVERARELGARSMAVTFDPHPMRILRPDVAPRLLTPLAVKLQLLAETGLDAVLVVPFTRDLSLMPPREFGSEVLCRNLRALEVHEGANFHFGHRAEGNVDLLRSLGAELGFTTVIYPEKRLRGDVVSSSRIRQLILQGRITRANRLLGRSFSVIGNAGRGRGYGHRYTVPTINLSRYDELAPHDGVYVTCTRVGQEQFHSVTNVGNRPTFGADSFAIETHLLNFHPIEVTSETEVEIAFLYRLREEHKFPTVDALREQIGRDVRRAGHYFELAKERLDS
ncbi:MAG: bifunctional riboflavin kinase/FAD synthetase [Acidobacteria bacterium]|nr:bifunctional riboflavin kinase/FAD synthetase [Acidobacteriota bacterium]